MATKSGKRKTYRRYKKYYYNRFKRNYKKTYTPMRKTFTSTFSNTWEIDLQILGGQRNSNVKPLGAFPTSQEAAVYALNNQTFNGLRQIFSEYKVNSLKVQVQMDAASAGSLYLLPDRHGTYTEAVPSANTVVQSPTATVVMVGPNTMGKITRSMYSSNVTEKSSYIDQSYDVNLTYFAFRPAFYLMYRKTENNAQNITTNHRVTIRLTASVTFRNPAY